MSIEEYHGVTFVAFLDICGFQVMMQEPEKSLDALSTFYQTGYNILGYQNNVDNEFKVDGLFVSDCGILFSRYNGEIHNDFDSFQNALKHLLSIIKNIFGYMLTADYMLTCSIAYGNFDYHERIEFIGMDKNLMLGYAYLNSFLDHEKGKPKLQPGQCRILKKDIDGEYWNNLVLSDEHPFNTVLPNRNVRNHLYFYWMVDNEDQIETFQKNYKDTYNLKYRGMLDILKNYAKPDYFWT